MKLVALLSIVCLAISALVLAKEKSSLKQQLLLKDQECVKKASLLIVNHNELYHRGSFDVSLPMSCADWHIAEVLAGVKVVN